MSPKRVPLFERLPEIYRIRDEEQTPPGQLAAYLSVVEDVFGAVYDNIESLYHDLFIEYCDDWVVPYIADLLGTSHLAGDPRTLRADVADTIALRRRKGTIGSIEKLAFDLTGWGVHCAELRENLAWHQHLNHQRPDQGGVPPYGRSDVNRYSVIRGGTATMRDPAMLSLIGTPFDQFAYTPDFRAPAPGAIRYNLPNLAIFLWRLEDYRIDVSAPVPTPAPPVIAPQPGDASFIARFDIHPMGEPVRLFNTSRFKPDLEPPVISLIDETPSPIPTARLNSKSSAGNPAAYVAVDTYTANPQIGVVGLQLHMPAAGFAPGITWTFRGADLTKWEKCLFPALKLNEIAIDPVIGRMVIGVGAAADVTALDNGLLVTYTYGSPGPVGAHPISRPAAPQTFNDEPIDTITVDLRAGQTLATALQNIQNHPRPVLIEIHDSMTHDLDIAALAGVLVEAGGANLLLNRTLIIRATDNNRPVIRLANPLRFRPLKVAGTALEQPQLDAIMDHLTVRLEGLYLTRAASFPAGQALIERAALNSLELLGCTLDPGGFQQLDGTRAPIHNALELAADYGFSDPGEVKAFSQTPEIHLQRSISGPLLVAAPYSLFLNDSIVDAGKGVGEDATAAFAVAAPTNPATEWGPPAQVSGLTVFGRMRVSSICGRGGVWVHALEVNNNQKGCLKYSYFCGVGDRLPQTFACVKGTGVHLDFTSSIFGQPGYGQLSLDTDSSIREEGPGDDQMGAFGFLLEAHKWRNMQIRFREFMPVGVRPLLIPVT